MGVESGLSLHQDACLSLPLVKVTSGGRVLRQRHGILASNIISITVWGDDEGGADGGVDTLGLASSVRKLG